MNWTDASAMTQAISGEKGDRTQSAWSYLAQRLAGRTPDEANAVINEPDLGDRMADFPFIKVEPDDDEE